MPKSEPKTPANAPAKEKQPPNAPVAKCPRDKAITITSETKETDIANRARTRIGVGETVTLTADPGPANWTIAHGMGELLAKKGANVNFVAPDEQGDVEISAEANGCTASIKFQVVAPSGVMMRRRAGTRKHHKKGTPSTGMILDIWILPADVSFRAVRIWEEDVRARCTGWFDGATPPGHNPGPPWRAQGVEPDGTRLSGGDRTTAYADSVGAGQFIWSIPWKYDVNGGSNEHRLPNNVEQVADFDNKGKATITKAGAEVSSKLQDATENDPLFPPDGMFPGGA